MKKKYLWMMAAILVCGMMTALTSCSNDDDTTILMAQFKQLTDLRKTICDKLNRVVV